MKDKFPLDDWGPVPEAPAPLRERLRTAGEATLVVAVFASGMLALLAGAALYLILLAASLCAYAFVGAFQVARSLICPSRSAPGPDPEPAPATTEPLVPIGARRPDLRKPRHPVHYCGRCGRDLEGRQGAPCQACDLMICARCLAERGTPQFCSYCEDDWYEGGIVLETHSPPGCGS